MEVTLPHKMIFNNRSNLEELSLILFGAKTVELSEFILDKYSMYLLTKDMVNANEVLYNQSRRDSKESKESTKNTLSQSMQVAPHCMYTRRAKKRNNTKATNL